ncbi:hypothetical protein AB0G83_15375 [Streptomyces klenkii]|uniref:hypothetical protein n=1 Tax=Streptomyces klenkii TaxID=1420899 RepID=UPI0033D416E6
MTERVGEWFGEGYLSAEDNQVVTERWQRAVADQERIDGILKGIQEETAQSHGGKLEGLENSLKGVDSLRRKAADGMREGDSAAKAVRAVNDIHRYTLTFEPDKYTEGVEQTYSQLRAQGYEPIPGKEKNTWDDPVYKGINTNWRHPEREEKFELQFHTPDSFTAKMENHELYEISRNGTFDRISKEEAPNEEAAEGLSEHYLNAANLLQNKRYENVETPSGQERIGDRTIRDKLEPDTPEWAIERVAKEEATRREENLAKARAEAARKQAEQPELGLDGPAQAESQGLRAHLATQATVQAARKKPEAPSIDPMPAQSRSRGPSLK